MGVFADLGHAMQNDSTKLISTAVSDIISAITPAVTTGVIIYFMITGYMVLAGRISEPIGDVCIKACKIAIVSTLCLSTGGIMSYVVSGVNGIESMFTHAISGNESNVFQVLDDSFNKGLGVAATASEKANSLGLKDLGTMIALYLSAIAVAGACIIMTLLAGALIMLSKVALAVILGLSPFFLAGLMFPVTAKWADSWFSQALNYAILSAIVIFVLNIGIHFFDSQMSAVTSEIDGGNPFPIVELLDIIIVALLTTFTIKQAPQIASGLAGGASSAGASLTGMVYQARQAGNWVSGTASATKNGVGRTVNNPVTRWVGQKTGVTPAAQRALNSVKNHFNSNSVRNS